MDKPFLEVDSSMISGIRHGGLAEKRMQVRFQPNKKTGEAAVYEYDNVLYETYLEIVNAESVGGEFHRLVRSNPLSHPFKKVN